MLKIDEKPLHNALAKWGEIAQFGQCLEECLELSLAIRKYFRHGWTKEVEYNIIDELADVILTTRQIEMLVNKDKLQERIDFKLNRLQNRINETK